MNITITGNLGSGKSSVAKILKEKGYEYSSTGNIFRQLAMDKGMSVEAFNKQVNEAASRGDHSVDKMIDDTTTRISEERDNVVSLRILMRQAAGYFMTACGQTRSHMSRRRHAERLLSTGRS